MNQFFNKLGFASNTTQPGVWQGQAAGYAYGGSLYARFQQYDLPADGLYRLRHPAAVHSGADTAGTGDGGHGKL
ncbi:conjugal transfer protein TraH [Escherichia coli]|nr:conjugal transfer protein TraH [Escherichia coli]